MGSTARAVALRHAPEASIRSISAGGLSGESSAAAKVRGRAPGHRIDVVAMLVTPSSDKRVEQRHRLPDPDGRE